MHRAINERQLDQLADIIDDNIEWAVYGPIDMFPFLGARHGKAAVLDVCKQIADNVRVHRFERESMILGDEIWLRNDALLADRAGFEPPYQPAAGAIRAVQGRAV